MAGYIKNSDGGYSVNYEDERFQDVKSYQAQKETQLNQTYDNILNNSDKYYENQINAAQDYAKQQTELQQAQTDFAIQQIEQHKDEAQKNYVKEQKGAYMDYVRQPRCNERNMVNMGLSNTGYSESTLAIMYNAYQNRVGTAKESLNNTIMNYNNSITQAIMANNEKLMEIANTALEKQLQLNQQAFEYKNTVILQKEQALQDLNNTYYARYQNVLNEINNEIELQMEMDRIDREYEQWLAEFNAERERRETENAMRRAEFEAQRERWRIQDEQWQKEYDLAVKQANASIAASRTKTTSINSQTNPYGKNEDSKVQTMSDQDYQSMKDSITSTVGVAKNSKDPTNVQNAKKKSALLFVRRMFISLMKQQMKLLHNTKIV